MKTSHHYLVIFISILCFSCASDESNSLEEVNPITVSFDSDRSWIYEGGEVQFSDNSTGNPSSWIWEFSGGDPSTSTVKNPKVTYSRAGSFSVTLTVSNGITEKTRQNVEQVTVETLDAPPFNGTVWMSPDIITPLDPTTFLTLEDAGQEVRNIYDRRVDAWVDYNAYIFKATYEGGKVVDFQLNPEFNLNEARQHAETYAPMIGQLPSFMMTPLTHVSIHGGDASAGGGFGGIELYTEAGASAIASGHMEELIMHEGGHVALQHLHNDEEYLRARINDPTYISTYAQDFAGREDISESIVPYFGHRYRREALPEDMIYKIEHVMKHRMEYFDKQEYDFYPLVQ